MSTTPLTTARSARIPILSSTSPDQAFLSRFAQILSPSPGHTLKLERLKEAVAANGYRTSAPELGQRIVLFYLSA